LTLLLSDRGLRERMGKCAAEYAQGYRWEKIAVQIVSVYEKLIGHTMRL